MNELSNGLYIYIYINTYIHTHTHRENSYSFKITPIQFPLSPSPAVLDGQVLAVYAVTALHESVRWLVVDGGQRADVANELVQQRWLDQVRLLGDQRLLGQHHLFGRHRVSGQQTPVDVATIPQVRVIGVLWEDMRM